MRELYSDSSGVLVQPHPMTAFPSHSPAASDYQRFLEALYTPIHSPLSLFFFFGNLWVLNLQLMDYITCRAPQKQGALFPMGRTSEYSEQTIYISARIQILCHFENLNFILKFSNYCYFELPKAKRMSYRGKHDKA